MQTYQHLLPGMQADAARTYERLARPRSTGKGRHGGTPEQRPDEDRLMQWNASKQTEGPGH